MQHRRDQAIEKTLLQFFHEIIFVEIICDLAIDQVPELVGILEIVHRDDVVLAALIERLDQVGTDKSGCAGDDVIHCLSPHIFKCTKQVPGGTNRAKEQIHSPLNLEP